MPNIAHKWREVHQKAQNGEILSAEEDHFIRDDGSIEWTRWECRPWYQSDRSIGGIIVYTELITKRKQMEQALRASEERLRLAVNSAQHGIYDLNLQTGEVVVNDIFAKMLDYDPVAFKETLDFWRERLHPDDYDRVNDAFQKYINGEIYEFKIEFRQKTAKGDWIWILFVGSIVEYDAEGRPLRMLGTHTNVTHSKNTETEMMLYNRIFEDSLNEIYIFDANTFKFSQVNQAALNNLGYTMEELRKMTPIDLKPLINWEEFINLAKPLQTGE